MSHLGFRESPVGGRGAADNSFSSDAPGSFGGGDIFAPLSNDHSERLAQAFNQCRDSAGFVSADAGKWQLERTGPGLKSQMLQQILHLSDLDRDGRLSLREFVCAMHLAEQARGGRTLPVEVRPEQQAVLARSVEPLVGHGNGSSGIPDASKPPRHDDFSTIDTAGTDPFGNRQRNPRNTSGVDLDSVTDFSGGFGSPGGNPSSAAGAFHSVAAARQDFGGSSSVRARPGGDNVDAALGNQKLGQLASVFETAAHSNPSELENLSLEVLEERKDLEQQINRRSEYQQQLQEVRAALDALRDDRRRVDVETAGIQRRVTHLRDELAFVESEILGAEGDLDALREASGKRSPEELANAVYERERLEQDVHSIREIRAMIDDHASTKRSLEESQEHLMEKQRHYENDRSHMLTAIEAERSKLSSTRSQRMKMWQERCALEKELAEHGAALPPSMLSAPLSSAAAGGGARGPVPSSTRLQQQPQQPRQQAPRPPDRRGIRHAETVSAAGGRHADGSC